MNIAIIGASGFIGKNLTKYLLEKTTHNLVLISRSFDHNTFDKKYENRTKRIKASVFDFEIMSLALKKIDVAYYFVHMMSDNTRDFYSKESLAAETVGKALKSAGVKRVIYMSGLGNDTEKLSTHLLSRHNTGMILRKYNNEVIEFRASMIIGKGSISFEIVKNIINKSPIITLPNWSKTKTQPIGIDDVLLYLNESILLNIKESQIVEIGGPEVMSYEEFIKKYANFQNKKTYITRIPILSLRVAGLLLDIFNSKEQAKVGQCMIDSFRNEMVVTNDRCRELFPNITPREIENSF